MSRQLLISWKGLSTATLGRWTKHPSAMLKLGKRCRRVVRSHSRFLPGAADGSPDSSRRDLANANYVFLAGRIKKLCRPRPFTVEPVVAPN
jgi:hypothetical protein